MFLKDSSTFFRVEGGYSRHHIRSFYFLETSEIGISTICWFTETFCSLFKDYPITFIIFNSLSDEELDH
jgi:hypothetical protein